MSTRIKCKHGKIEYYCTDCGGNGLCIHKRQRYYCVDCGGGAVCIHDSLEVPSETD
jgi:hypothetical protein